MIDIDSLVADFDTNKLLTLLGPYVCFPKKKRKRKKKKERKKKVIKKKRKRKKLVIIVSLLFSNDASRPLYNTQFNQRKYKILVTINPSLLS